MIPLYIEKFDYDEFACKCKEDCYGKNINPINFPNIDGVVFYLTHLRKVFKRKHRTTNVQIWITSGLRCVDHNKNVGGVADSDHLELAAVDIQIYVKGIKIKDEIVLQTVKAELPLFVRYVALTPNRS